MHCCVDNLHSGVANRHFEPASLPPIRRSHQHLQYHQYMSSLQHSSHACYHLQQISTPFVAYVCGHACRRVSALAGAATAVKSAMTALNTLMSGGDDQDGGPVQCNLLIQAAAAVPEQTSLPMQAIQAIESSLTYPEPTAKASWYSALHFYQIYNQSPLFPCVGMFFPSTFCYFWCLRTAMVVCDDMASGLNCQSMLARLRSLRQDEPC